MISCISCETIHLFGPAFHSQFCLRYRAFIERQDYDVRIYNGMEYDQYDTPASHYLVYHTEEGRALGVSRLTPNDAGLHAERPLAHHGRGQGAVAVGPGVGRHALLHRQGRGAGFAHPHRS